MKREQSLNIYLSFSKYWLDKSIKQGVTSCLIIELDFVFWQWAKIGFQTKLVEELRTQRDS